MNPIRQATSYVRSKYNLACDLLLNSGIKNIRPIMAAVHQFHLRYRWAFLLIAVCIFAGIFWGSAEVFKAIWGLGLEQVLLRAGQFAKAAEEERV